MVIDKVNVKSVSIFKAKNNPLNSPLRACSRKVGISMPAISSAACKAERMILIRSNISGGNLLPSSRSNSCRSPLCRKLLIILSIVNCKLTFYKHFSLSAFSAGCRQAVAMLFHNTASHDLSARNRTIHAAHVVHHYTLKEIGDHVRLHYTTVGRIIRNQHRMLQRKTVPHVLSRAKLKTTPVIMTFHVPRLRDLPVNEGRRVAPATRLGQLRPCVAIPSNRSANK